MKKLPLVTIIGVPNTGKSTLFNRLCGENKALVHSQPGMTRDIFQARCRIDDRVFMVQDSGGFFPDRQALSEAVNQRILDAAAESKAIIFLFDAKRDLLGYEKDLFLEVKKINRNLISVLNKVDNPESFICPASYYSLKVDFISIAATHNINLDALYGAVLQSLAGSDRPGDQLESHRQAIAVFGKPNVGKSTLVNAFLGREKMIVRPEPGTTRDSVESELKRNRATLLVIDNAGLRKKSKIAEETEIAGVIKAEKTLKKADVLIMVLDISRPLDQNDLLIAAVVQKAAKPVIIALNKSDLLEEPGLCERRAKEFRKRLHGLYFADMQVVSALNNKNVGKILDKTEEIYDKLHVKKIKTANLNKIIRLLLAERRYLTISGLPFQPKYFSVESYQPFFVKFHSKRKDRLRPADELYLKKRLLAEIGWQGIPVFFKLIAKD